MSATATPLRGAAAPAPALQRGRKRARDPDLRAHDRSGARGPKLPVAVARGSMLLALLVIGGLRWMSLLEPAEPFRAWEATGIAILGGAALVGAARLPGLLRPLSGAAATLAMLALCLLAGGLADEYLRPDRWGALAAGVGRGLEALPGINVPYQGQDVWTQLVLAGGGTLLMAGATALALWPRRDRTGFPLLALVLLVSLAVVPAVVLAFEGEYILGAALAVLVLGFLRMEKLGRRDLPAAGGLAAVAAFAALVVAPAMDGRQPWWDYETWALSASTTRTTSFAWDHDYSPLDWPRDGRELLRIRAPRPAYWKAQDLDVFAGGRWQAGRRDRSRSASGQIPESTFATSRWQQEIRVTVRNLRTPTFVTAGIATEIDDLPDGADAFPAGNGLFGATRALTRGDTYRATVYTPRPSDRQLAVAGTDEEAWLTDFRRVFVTADRPAGSVRPGTARPDHVVTFPTFEDASEPFVQAFFDPLGSEPEAAADVLDRAGLGRAQALADRLREGAATPFEYVQRIEEHLDDGYRYSETPPPAARTLDGFLFDARVGFCQQYSGAMALLLRLGGIPARVAAGFTTGALDREENEYVVRDLDAHSWVEVWFPGYGWVTRDPTPAAAPPRSQPGDGGAAGPGGAAPAPDLPGGAQTQAPATDAAGGGSGGTPLYVIVLGVLLALALVVGLPLERRRRRRLPPVPQRPMAEFERALRRTRYDGGAGMTLSGFERAFAGWPGAAGYVRALREQRYSGRPATPTPDQRRSLRRALARDAGRVRAWWALPPRAPASRVDEDAEIVRRARA